LLWYDFEIEPQPFKHRLDNHSPGSVKRRVNDTQRFCLANNLRIENQRLEPLHVRFIDFFSERRDFSLSILRQRREAFGRDRIYFCNDSARVRVNHLRAIAKINFVAIIMRRIMTRRYHDARVRFEIANSERKLRHRTRSVEYKRVATILRGNFGSEFSEFL